MRCMSKKWTTLIGINVIGALKLAKKYGIFNLSKKDPEKMMTVARFAGVFGWQVIKNDLVYC
jgi:hypothetical protein